MKKGYETSVCYVCIYESEAYSEKRRTNKRKIDNNKKIIVLFLSFIIILPVVTLFQITRSTNETQQQQQNCAHIFEVEIKWSRRSGEIQFIDDDDDGY